MGQPSTRCGGCEWYIRGHVSEFDSRPGYGGCFRARKAVHANQTACIGDYEPGTPSWSLDEAWLKDGKRRAADEFKAAKSDRESLLSFVKEVFRWREKCHDHDDDMGHHRRDFGDDENWEMLERNAGRVLESIGENGSTTSTDGGGVGDEDQVTNGMGEVCDFDSLPEKCGGTGMLECRCGGDQCYCGNHGEVECYGCVDCDPER